MNKLPVELQGEGTYTYKCEKIGCFHCEYMANLKNNIKQEFGQKDYSFGVIPIKKYYRKKSA